MEPRAAEALARFVECGGRLIIVGAPPTRAPGLFEAGIKDAAVAEVYRRIMATAANRVLQVEPPREEELLSWTVQVLAKAGSTRDVVFDQERVTLSQVYHREGDRSIHFLVNTSEREAMEVRANFPAARGAAWLWDTETGARSPILANADGSLELRFQPLESKLVVFEPKQTRRCDPSKVEKPAESSGRTEQLVRGPWQLEFIPAWGAATFEREVAELGDLSLSPDEQVKDFGGRVVYRTVVRGNNQGGSLELDLGFINGTCEVRFNGVPLGVQWWGRRVYALTGRLRAGDNFLEIEVTTPLANRLRSMRDDPSAQRWAWWAPPIEMGLLGPVILRSGSPEDSPER